MSVHNNLFPYIIMAFQENNVFIHGFSNISLPWEGGHPPSPFGRFAPVQNPGWLRNNASEYNTIQGDKIYFLSFTSGSLTHSGAIGFSNVKNLTISKYL